MSEDIEARLLASIPDTDAFVALAAKGITQESFTRYGAMYRYIEELVAEHDHLPRLIDLKATFNLPAHVKREPKEFSWLCDEFLRITTVQRIQSILESGVELHGEKPSELIGYLTKQLQGIVSTETRDMSVSDESAGERMEAYAANIPAEGMITGIPTGLSYYDAEERLGWLPGELIGIVGRLYTGKSWLLIWHGLIAWHTGRRVLFLSPELPKEEAEARLDALAFRFYGAEVNTSDLYRGYKPTEEQRTIAEKMAKRHDWVTLSSADGKPFRLLEIPRLIQQYEPDILLIDGLPLIAGESRGGRQQMWEIIKELSYGLKNIAIGSDITILVTHQANRDAGDTGRPPRLDEISFGDAFAQACDRIQVISRPKRKRDRLKLTIQKYRRGEPKHGGIMLHFEPGAGIVEEALEDDDHEDERSGEIGPVEPGEDGGVQEGEGVALPVSLP